MLSDQAELPVRNEILNLPVHKHFTTRQNLEIWFVLQTIKIIFFFPLMRGEDFRDLEEVGTFFIWRKYLFIYIHIYIFVRVGMF